MTALPLGTISAGTVSVQNVVSRMSAVAPVTAAEARHLVDAEWFAPPPPCPLSETRSPALAAVQV